MIRNYSIEFIKEYDRFDDENPNTTIDYDNFLEKKIIALRKELNAIKEKYGINDNRKNIKNKPFKILKIDKYTLKIAKEFESLSEVTRKSGLSSKKLSERLESDFFWVKIPYNCARIFDEKSCSKCHHFINRNCKLKFW